MNVCDVTSRSKKMFTSVSTSYELSNILGTCTNGAGIVQLSVYRPQNIKVAVKKVPLDQADIAELQREVFITWHFRHRNILTYYTSFLVDKHLWIVLPYRPLGSVSDQLMTEFPSGLPELTVAYMLQQVLQGLDYLHGRNMVHRSVKGRHILLSPIEPRVMLSGLKTTCSMIRSGTKLNVIHGFPARALATSLQWLAPEILEQSLRGYGTKSDIYSVGITACEVANGCVPFCDMPPSQMLLEKLVGTIPKLLDSTTLPDEEEQEVVMATVANGTGPQSSNAQTPAVPEGGAAPATAGQPSQSTAVYQCRPTFSTHFHEFVDICLRTQSDQRPSADQLLNHPFMKQLKKNQDMLDRQWKKLTSFKPGEPVAELTHLASGMSLDQEDDVVWNF